MGILRRAKERLKLLPKMLETALMLQSEIAKMYRHKEHIYMQYVAGFLTESSATAHTVGFEEWIAPTMKAGGKAER